MPQEELQLPENVFFVLNSQLIPLDRSEISFGRHPDNDVIISEGGVSRFHAKLCFEDGQFVVYDLDAKNGTFVNGLQVKRQAIQSGDTLTLAGTPMLFIDRSASIIQQTLDDTSLLEPDRNDD